LRSGSTRACTAAIRWRRSSRSSRPAGGRPPRGTWLGRSSFVQAGGADPAVDSGSMLLLGLLLAGLLPTPHLAEPAPALMPVPAAVTWRVGKLRLDSSFTVRLAGPVREDRLARAVARFVHRAGGMTGLLLDRG